MEIPKEAFSGKVVAYKYDAEEDDMADYSGYDDNDEDDYTHNDTEAAETTTPTLPPIPESPTPTFPPTTEEITTAEEPESTTNSYTTEDRVKITPYSESASETINQNVSIMPALIKPRVLDESVFLSAGREFPSTTTEQDTQTVVIRASNELPAMTSEKPVTSPSPAPAEIPTTESTTTSSTTVSSTSTTTSTTMPPSLPPSLPPALPPTELPTTTSAPETTLQEVTEQDTIPTEGRSTINGQTTETVIFAMPINQPPTLKHHMKKLAIIAGKAFRYIIPADLFTDPEEGSNLTFTMYEAENVPLSKNSWIQFIPAGREFKLLKHYNNGIDWQIRALEGIVNLFRDTDMDHLTVLNATQKGDLCEFIMESDTEPGSPSAGLIRAMSPELKVGGVSWRGVGRCAQDAPATRAPDTYPPVTRNQVDHLTATVGHMFVYKVPEDGGTRNLALSLRYSDRTELPAGHWLQFDARNQEFYGLPAPSDEASVNYQLIAEDSSKKSAYDSLIVEVVKAPTIRPTVEFQMTMEYPFARLAYDASNKRKVVEKLAALFGQQEPSNIRIHSITNNPTTIIWYNTSLPMDRCPKKEIEELRKMIIVEERGSSTGALRDNVDHIFDLKELKVMSIRLIPLGLCAEQNTKVPKTNIQVYSGAPNSANSKAGSANDQSYLVTFIIPAVVIVCMILLAGIVACVLYRRRRT
ncbi:Dystroglycan, partial [Operophtera brumata]